MLISAVDASENEPLEEQRRNDTTPPCAELNTASDGPGSTRSRPFVVSVSECNGSVGNDLSPDARRYSAMNRRCGSRPGDAKCFLRCGHTHCLPNVGCCCDLVEQVLDVARPACAPQALSRCPLV